MELPFAESWKIKMVEPIHKSTRQQREQWLKEAHYNVFQLRSEQVYIDLLTDSGTGAMSDRQWAELMLGDESYAGATSFYKFESAVQRIFGFKHVIPTHQGRAAENVLFSYLVKPGMVVPGNAHFDTTKGHIESRKAKAIDVTIDEAHDTQLEIPFKGNVSLEKLEKVLKENKGNVPFMVLTVTNNTVGGQPVSMENIKATCKLCHQYGVPVVMDSARFAENAYFIKTREKGYADKTIKEIVREMYEDVDAATMSCKKDAIVNMGGFIATSRDDWYEGAKLYCIPFETRIHQVQYLASLLDEYGIPYQRPAGGHAIFVDGDKVLDRVPKEEFPAQTLTCELYLEAGIRACEIGYMLADRDPVTRENRFGGLDLVRLCIPRRVYTDNHMKVVAAALKNVYDRRESISRGVAIEWEAPLMRHFTVQLRRL